MLQILTDEMINPLKIQSNPSAARIRALFALIGVSFSLLACTASAPSSTPDATGVATPETPASTTAPTSHLGTVDGGGGKGVLCGSRVRTLDLYEGEEVLKLPIVRTSVSFDDVLFERGMALGSHINEINFADHPIDQYLKDAFKRDLRDDILNRVVYIPSGTRLALTSDAHVPLLTPDCQQVQIAVYGKDDKLHVDKDYWDALTADDQAALVLHEWLYRRARQYGALDSDETRGVIARIFSKQDPLPMFSPLWNRDDYLTCMGGGGQAPYDGPNYEFFAVQDSENGVAGIRFYFRALDGIYLMNRATAFVPDIGIADLNWRSQKQWAAEAHVERSNSQDQRIEFNSFQGSCGMEFTMRTHVVGAAKPALSHFTCMSKSDHGSQSRSCN